MVACWNWIRDFVYKHCNSSYRQSQCADNKNTHNRTWIAKSQNESTEYCSRTTSTFRRYSNRFSIFLETHIFPNRFNYLWSVFLYHSRYLSLSLVVIRGSDLVVDDIRKLPFIFTCPFIWHFFDNRRELRLNHHNIQCDHNSLFMEYWAMTKINQFIVTNTLIAMMTMLINQYNENEMEKRTFEQVDWIDKSFEWMCWIKTFHYQDANSQCIQRSSVCHCLRREKRERDTR